MMRAIVTMVDAAGLKIFVIVSCLEYIKLVIIIVISSSDMVACVRKYLVNASVTCGLIIRVGIIASMFISVLIQISNQCELVSTIMVPKLMVSRMILKTIHVLVWEAYKLTFQRMGLIAYLADLAMNCGVMRWHEGF